MQGATFLLLLAFIPVVGYWQARRLYPSRLFTVVGVTLGAVLSPFALGLYSLYFLSPWGVAPGLFGLGLSLIHGVPGFKLAVHSGLIPSGVATDLAVGVTIELINGVVWAIVYGLIGFAIDLALQRRRSPP